MRILSKKTALLSAVLLITGLLTGCGSNSKKDGTLTLKSSPFPEIQGRSDIAAELKIGGKTCSLTIDPDTTLLSGQCSDLSLGTLSYTLDYRHTPSGAVVARADGTITIAAGGNAVIDIPPLEKKLGLDDDEDGFTNLEEVLAGTDPENPDPGASLVKLVVTLSGVGTGNVLYDPPGIDSPTYNKLYAKNAVVTLTAVPSTGYAFAGWGGDCTGTAPSITVTMAADKTCTAAFGVPWTLSTLDSAGTVGQYSSIALDSANKVHIAYYDATDGYLKHITDAAGSWGLPELVDPSGDVGRNASIAVDSTDRVHIAYYDATNRDLKYATNAGGSWIETTVDSSGDAGQYTSIALDATNKVHIGYYDVSNTALKYAACSTNCTVTSSWAVLQVDNSSDVGQFASLAVDTTGKRYIGYYDATNGDLKYAESISPVNLFFDDFESGIGQWTADPPWGLTTSSFHSGSNSATDSPIGNYANSVAVSLTMTVTITGLAELSFWHKYSTAALLDQARVDISTDGGTTWPILHSSYSGQSPDWTPVSIDLSSYIDQPVLIRFILITDESSNYDGWYIDDVAITENHAAATVDTAGDVGQYASIALDSMNKVHMSYYDATNRDLKYATNATGSWTTTTIDNGGDVGRDSSIALDSNNKIYIAYYDATNGDLKYTTNATGSWVAYTIDSAGDVGRYASIAVDSNSNVHIAYYDATNKDLKYAASQ
jgi:uncharacterized repeat protein (TIGR02543 family)